MLKVSIEYQILFLHPGVHSVKKRALPISRIIVFSLHVADECKRQ